MKRILGFVCIMALSLLLALGALGIGLYQWDAARWERELAASDFASAEQNLERLEKRIRAAKVFPLLFAGVLEDVQVRKNRLRYWRKDYAAILAEDASAGDERKTACPELRFIRANARYQTLAVERNREKVLQDLGRIIADYAAIVDADPSLDAAAFNYEFLSTLRGDIASGRRQIRSVLRAEKQLPEEGRYGAHGEQGREPKGSPDQTMKVLVPKEGDENPEKQGKEPSRGSATKKSG